VCEATHRTPRRNECDDDPKPLGNVRAGRPRRSEALDALVSSGVSILDGLEVMAKTATISMILVGEQTGGLYEMLTKIANFQSRLESQMPDFACGIAS
jgi:type II secretory pathway component PulF